MHQWDANLVRLPRTQQRTQLLHCNYFPNWLLRNKVQNELRRICWEPLLPIFRGILFWGRLHFITCRPLIIVAGCLRVRPEKFH